MTLRSRVGGVGVCQFNMCEFGPTELNINTSTHPYYWCDDDFNVCDTDRLAGLLCARGMARLCLSGALS
jgi:hypothetical protein